MQKKLVFLFLAIFLVQITSSEKIDLKSVGAIFSDFMRNQVFQNPDQHKSYFEGSKILSCEGKNLTYDEFAHEITDKMDRRLGFNITLSSIAEKNSEILAEYLIFENFQNPDEILKQTINVIYKNSGSVSISEVKSTCEKIN